LAGNIGKSAIEILPRLNENSLVILELSSFQLQHMEASPEIAAVLDIFPDHLDSHKNFKEYLGAKANIARWQSAFDTIFYSNGNKIAAQIARQSRAKKIPVSTKNFQLFKPEDLKMPGEHNFKNAAMATSIALYLGCPKEKIIKVVKNFRGNEHRLELVKKIRGINFYNDSASTNPQTAAAAIKSFKECKILIAGGKDKGLDYSPLASALKNSNTKLVILLGENKNKIKMRIVKSKVQIVLVKDLKSAIQLAYKTAKSLMANGYPLTTILFSPASASFDMFKDYADRGKKFKQLVRKLK